MKLEQEAAFAVELLSNHFHGRPRRRIMEDAVKRLATDLLQYGPNKRSWSDIWDPVEAVRELRKLTAEGYNSTSVELIAQRFLRAHWWLFYSDHACTSPRYGTADLLYPKLHEYVQRWREAGETDISDAIAKDLKAAGVTVPKRND